MVTVARNEAAQKIGSIHLRSPLLKQGLVKRTRESVSGSIIGAVKRST
nr:hypothetical protein [Sporolactobacillus inulinus]